MACYRDSFTFYIYCETLIKYQFNEHMHELKAKKINLPLKYLCQWDFLHWARYKVRVLAAFAGKK
jgi:hypothetical protein